MCNCDPYILCSEHRADKKLHTTMYRLQLPDSLILIVQQVLASDLVSDIFIANKEPNLYCVVVIVLLHF